MRNFLLCFIAACAAPQAAVPPAPTRLQAAPPRAAPRFDAREFAAEQVTPGDCEVGARQLHERDAKQGWEALVACVERARWPRGAFTLLERITGGYWDEDLQSRPDAPRLIAKVIAHRGGDVEGDIPLAQKSRVPVFTLAAALRQPDVYKGRWVLLRGALSELRQENGKAAAMVRETSLRASSHEVQVGDVFRRDSTSSGSASADIQTTRYGNASADAQYRTSGRDEFSRVRQKFDNEHVETGRKAVGKLAQADPFLEPEKDFIFLGRFDGVRAGEDGERPVAMISISGYFRPNALLVQ